MPTRSTLACLVVLGAFPSAVLAANTTPPDERGSFTLLIENDAITGSDRHYTNGIQASWLSSEVVPAWVHRLGNYMPFFAPDSRRRYGVGIGQSIFTPNDTSRSDLILDDRPYAGWLYGAFSLIADKGNQLDTFELNIGVVGPDAQGEWVQNHFHDLIGSDEANGWDNQLKNEFGVVLFYERKWRRLLETERGGLGLDVTPNLGGAIGNVYTYAAAGGMVRVGQDLPADYGSPRVRPALAGSGFFHPTNGFGWYVFAGVEGRAVAHDIFLDGNTFRDSHSVDKEPFVADLQAGLAITFDSFRIAFTHIYRTREFKGQDEANRFSALSISFRW